MCLGTAYSSWMQEDRGLLSGGPTWKPGPRQEVGEGVGVERRGGWAGRS